MIKRLLHAPHIVRRVKLKIVLFISALMAVGLVPTAIQAQQQASICVLTTNNANGVATTSCVPVSTTNPFPIANSGGVSCPAGTVSLTTLVITNGIVTHC